MSFREDYHSVTPIEGVPIGSPLDQLHREGYVHGRELDKLLIWKIGLVGEKGDNGTVGAIKKDIAWAKRLVGTAIIAALAAVGGWISQIYTKGQEDGAQRLRMEILEKRIESLTADHNQIRMQMWQHHAKEIP